MLSFKAMLLASQIKIIKFISGLNMQRKSLDRSGLREKRIPRKMLKTQITFRMKQIS